MKDRDVYLIFALMLEPDGLLPRLQSTQTTRAKNACELTMNLFRMTETSPVLSAAEATHALSGRSIASEVLRVWNEQARHLLAHVDKLDCDEQGFERWSDYARARYSTVETASANKTPILPSKLATVKAMDGERDRLPEWMGKRFSVMPTLFPNDEADVALPLALYELGNHSVDQGRGAPLSLRIFVESVMSVPLRHHTRGLPIPITATFREFLSWLYPRRRPKPNEYYPRLMRAVEELDDAWIDFPTGRKRIVAVSSVPRHEKALDDVIRFVVDLPQGTDGSGPSIDRHRLQLLGVESAVKYRLFLNLNYEWWLPGRRQRPIGKGENRIWTVSSNAKDYRPLTDRQLLQMAYPLAPDRLKRQYVKKVRDAVREMEAAGLLRIVEHEEGWILMPAIARIEDKGAWSKVSFAIKDSLYSNET